MVLDKIKRIPVKFFINVDFSLSELNKIPQRYHSELKKSSPKIDLDSPAVDVDYKRSKHYEEYNKLLELVRLVKKQENRKQNAKC